MNVKQFLKPDWRNIVIFVLLMVIILSISLYFPDLKITTTSEPTTTTTLELTTTMPATTTTTIPKEPTTLIITKTKSFAPGIPIKIESILPTFDQPINLNDDINIIYVVSVEPSYGTAENVTAIITLPEGVEFVDGTLNWNGNLTPDETISFNTKIKIIKTGNWTLEARADYPLGEGSFYGDRDSICISIKDNEVIIAHGDKSRIDSCDTIPECKDIVLPDGTVIKCTRIR